MDAALVTALALLAIFTALIVPLALLLHGRQKFLRTMGIESADGLAAMTAALFDGAPSSRATSATAVVEGRRRGEAIEIRASYIQTYSYALMTVTMSLRGAQPKLRVIIKEHMLEIDALDLLIDDDTKDAIRDYANRVQGLKRIEVTPRGLVLTLTGTPHEPDEDKAKRLALTVELAERVRKRILDGIERKAMASAKVRVGAGGYRVAVDPMWEEEEEPKTLRARRAG
jgi:hypothetical protein